MSRQKIVCDLNRLWDGFHPEPWLVRISKKIQEESQSLWQDVAAVGTSRLYQPQKDMEFFTTSHPLERVRGWFHTLPEEIKTHTEIVASEKATAMRWELMQIKRSLDEDPSANVSIAVDWMIDRDDLQATLAVIDTKDRLGRQLQTSLKRLDVWSVKQSDIWDLLPLRQVGTELSNRLNAVSRLHHEDWWGKLVL